MPQHASNSERIARAAAEAEARATEKAAAKKEKASKPAKPKSPRASKSRSSAAPGRRKIVWAVGKPGLEPVAEYPYPQRAEADAEAVRRGAEFMVSARRVPM